MVRFTLDAIGEIPYSPNMIEKRSNAGRKKNDAADTLLPYAIRLRPAERTIIEMAAEKAGQSARQWMRLICVNAATEILDAISKATKRKNDDDND